MECHSSIDRRFAVQHISDARWRRATEVSLAADHRNGYDLWTTAFVEPRADWQEFAEFLRTADRDSLDEFVAVGRPESLGFLVLMLTGACNADCPICFTDRRRKRGELGPRERDAVIAQAAELGAGYVYVPGEGEPTIDRGWWEFLESCRAAGTQAVVFTNGIVFSDAATSRKYWDCEPEEAVARLADYPVSLYVKMWSTAPELVGEMMRIDPAKYRFVEYDGVAVPYGMARLLDDFPREQLGIEVVVERRNADEVVERIVPFAEQHGLAQIVEMIQHNGRTLGKASYDPTPEQARAVSPYLTATSCSVATCKAVVTSRGALSPRIAILEAQLPQPPRFVTDGELWDLLHTTDYLVQRRYELSCLCESEPVALAAAAGSAEQLVGPTSVVPPSLAGAMADQRGAAAGVSTVTRAAPPARAAGSSSPADGTDAPAGDLHDGGAGPDTPIASLLAGVVRHDDRVSVVGRAHPAGAGLVRLADGRDVVQVAGVDLPAYSWARVFGRWDALTGVVRADGADIVVQPSRQPFGNLVPEFAYVREPAALAAVQQRSALVDAVRSALRHEGFLEVVTPMLAANAEMCQVNQGITDVLCGRRFYLRTDPEEYLKRYLTAGLPAVFEVSTNVRADGADDWHLMEFQSVEYYRRLMTFDEAIAQADRLVRVALGAVDDARRGDTPIALDRPIQRMRFADLFQYLLGVDVLDERCATTRGLAAALAEAGYPVEVQGELAAWRRTWLEEALDQHVLPTLRQPLWVTHFPADIGLSSRLDPADPRCALRAELYLPGGLELAHVYENIHDGAELRARYDQRRAHRVASGLSYVPTNEQLMSSAEAGMPPMAGGAIGLDRLLMVARGDGVIGRGLLFAHEGFTGRNAAAQVCGVSAGGCGNCSGGCR